MATEMTWIPPSALALLTEELAQLAAHPNPPAESLDRIRELRRILRSTEATIKPDDGLIEPGMRVTAMFAGDTRATVFLISERELATLDPHIRIDVFSPSSPLGQAIIGCRVGDIVTYTTASRAVVQVELLAAVPYSGNE